jgi:hypothetical protein
MSRPRRGVALAAVACPPARAAFAVLVAAFAVAACSDGDSDGDLVRPRDAIAGAQVRYALAGEFVGDAWLDHP